MGYKQSVREYDSILKNIDFATGWNQTTDSALNDLGDTISQAREAAITAIGPEGVDSRDQLANKHEQVEAAQ
jgi:flagellin-like hook-associated protein FlgL